MSQEYGQGEDVAPTNTEPSTALSFRPTVHHSTSVPESVTSWQESTFESSYQESGKGNDKSPSAVTFAKDDNSKDNFQKMKNRKLGELFASTEMLFNSGREENKRMKAVFGVFSGVAVGSLIFVLLYCNFEYSGIVAGTVASVSTIFICIGLAFFPTCRCIMALVFPNFTTGKGRTLLLSVIFAGMLTGPILNITHNGKEIGNSMACVIDLIANQSRILLQQSKEPIRDVAKYIEQQRQSLENIQNSMFVDFKELRDAIDALENDFNVVDTSMNKIYEECTSPLKTANEKCIKQCNILILPNPKAECLTWCRTLTDICSPLKISDNFAGVTKDMKDIIGQAEKYFSPGVKVDGNFEDNGNNSGEISMVQRRIDEKTESSVLTIKTIITTMKYVLSLSLLLMFIQAFLYFKNYMAKDGYDNIYITKEFIELDKKKEENGEESLLPIKKIEKSEYIHTRSLKLTKQELDSCKTGLAHVFIHAFICFVVVLFDFFLYYILNLIQTFGKVEIDLNDKRRLTVDVEGKGFIASFYKEIFKGINIDDVFHVHVNLDKCLPNPTSTSGDTVVGFFLLYLLALCFVMFHGYGMRMRRKIAAYFFPEQEASRMEYLHKTIRHKRIARQRFLRQEVRSAHKESFMKKGFRLSTWLITNCKCIAKLVPSREQLECSSCEETKGTFDSVKLTKCTGVRDDVACTAVYCDDCRVILGGVCPLCYQEE
ncbi:DC-STAMP domain-containing protein 2-like, partial [Ruditapes philippinarum]|uniref:DC-STAMP domain-containing protein 2-like n=1 Tax=Ruditapes philippinarum TaxID=129788 RepID=UPI00295AC707